MYGIFYLYSKHFQIEKKFMKYNNIFDMLHFVIIMCCFSLVSGTGKNKKGKMYIRRNSRKHAIDLLEL